MNATMTPNLPALDALLPARAAQATRHLESGAGSFADSLRDAHRDMPSPSTSNTSSRAPQISRTQSETEAARNTERLREERRAQDNKARSTDKTGEASAGQADRGEGAPDRSVRSRSDRGRAEHRHGERSPTDKSEASAEDDTPVSPRRAGERKKLSHKSGQAAEADAQDPMQLQSQAQAQAQTQVPKPADELARLAAQATSSTLDTQAADATVAATLLASPVAGGAEALDGTAVGIDAGAAIPSLLSGSSAVAGDNTSTRSARKGGTGTVAGEAAAPGRSSMKSAMQDVVEDMAASDTTQVQQVPSTSQELREPRAARGAPDERAALRENTSLTERRESLLTPDKPLLIDATPLREALATPLSKLADQAATLSGISGLSGIHGTSGGSAYSVSTQGSGTQGFGAAEHTLAANPGSPDFTRALGAQVSMWASEGTREARLHLNPAELGPVLVHITLDGAQARVDFHAHAAATREALEASLPALAGALSEQGLTLSGGGVFDRGGQARDRDAEQAQAAQSHDARGSDDSNAQASAAARPSARVMERRGLVDLMA